MPERCTYELHVKTAKEELVRKIKQLELENDQLKADVIDKDVWIQSITELFSFGAPGTSVLERLKDHGELHDALVTALSSVPQTTRHEIVSPIDGRDSDADEDEDMSDGDTSPSRWTRVTEDDDKIHHLMALYFAWVHPAHMFFSEQHFIDSFRSHDGRYCSAALVNAICALGSRYCVDKDGNEVAIKRLGERFTQQVHVELRAERNLTPLSSVSTLR